MKLLKVIKWEASKKAIVDAYADTASDLAANIGDLTLSKGSKAYLANGEAYILGNSWTKVGNLFPSGGGTPVELPQSEQEEF